MPDWAIGQISAERYSCDTADGAGKDRQSALRRLARTVCADLEEIGEAGALAIAGQAEEHGLYKVVAAGTGESLIAEAAAFLGMECTRISERYGPRILDVFLAYAVAKLGEIESPISSKDYKSKRQFKGGQASTSCSFFQLRSIMLLNSSVTSILRFLMGEIDSKNPLEIYLYQSFEWLCDGI